MKWLMGVFLFCAVLGVVSASAFSPASMSRCSTPSLTKGCVLPSPSASASPSITPFVSRDQVTVIEPSYDPEYKRMWEVDHAKDVQKGWTQQAFFKKIPLKTWMQNKNIVGGYTKIDGTQVVFVK